MDDQNISIVDRTNNISIHKKLNSSNVDDLLDEDFAEAKKKELSKIKTSFNILDNEFMVDKKKNQNDSSLCNMKNGDDIKKNSLDKNIDDFLKNEAYLRKESNKE
jgi:hypothetical protein